MTGPSRRPRVRLLGALVLAAGAITACGGSSHPPRISAHRLGASSECSSAIAAARPLASVRTAMLDVHGPPFGVATTRDDRWSFVVVGGGLDAFSDASFTPHLVRSVPLPQPALGLAVTHDGRELLVADEAAGAMVLSVARVESGASEPLLGTLRPSTTPPGGGGAIEVAASRDDRFAFVSVEYGNEVTVYDLRAALADRFGHGAFVGAIPLGRAVVGEALSPDGRTLYVTSELAAGQSLAADGTLSVIDVATAEHDPAKSVVATADAHCQPVRVAVSPDGGTVWVTARASDQLLAFSAARLRRDPRHALLAAVRVGEAPVGLAVLAGGGQVAVADSDRFGAPGRRASLTFVDARSALGGKPAVTGTVAAGRFPREMALEPNGRTLLVGNFGSGQLEAVDVAALPSR